MPESLLYATLPSARSTRLIRLHPGTVDEKLSCSLEVVEDLFSPPRYQALSYCWGDENDVTELSCNGEALWVTRNLCAALQHLRQTKQSILVWADAVCINQRDIPERNQQVSIMNQIYQHASRVWIWIGPGNEDSLEAMVMIRKIAHCIHDGCKAGTPIASWLLTLSAEYEKGNVISKAYPIKAEHFPRKDWASFWLFYQADWFYRVWVIQEVRQTRDVWLLCGNSEIEWDFVALSASWAWLGAIQDFATHWKREHFPSYNGFVNANLMWDQTLTTRRQAPFLALLHLARPFQSTDPRDKVFAMLHHCINQLVIDDRGQHIESRLHPSWPDNTPRSHLDFRPDYNMTTYQVYREVALQSLRQYQNLELLSYAWQTAHYSSSWPSWIPRWDIPNNHVTPLILPFLYDAARGTSIEYHLDASRDSISVQGLNLGALVEMSSILKLQIMSPKNTGPDNSTTKTNLLSMLNLITQDRWQQDLSSETTATRSQNTLDAHFANFSSYVLRLIQGRNEDSYISTYSIWCEYCREYISHLRGGASSTPVEFFHCNICSYGDWDVCASCYHKGQRCKATTHTLRKLNTTCLWIPYTDEVLRILERHAAGGEYERFNMILYQSCRRAAFFKTSRGDRGTASVAMQPGDIVVLLFGSRVPFILRRLGSVYRLVSDCYIEGLMDGEAVDMWRRGELEPEDFEIR